MTPADRLSVAPATFGVIDHDAHPASGDSLSRSDNARRWLIQSGTADPRVASPGAIYPMVSVPRLVISTPVTSTAWSGH
jgi:hypothetical protein